MKLTLQPDVILPFEAFLEVVNSVDGGARTSSAYEVSCGVGPVVETIVVDVCTSAMHPESARATLDCVRTTFKTTR